MLMANLGDSLVALEPSQILLIGGRDINKTPQKLTYKMDTANLTTMSSWSRGPSLLEERYGHSCGTFEIGGSKYVIVAGGAKMFMNFQSMSIPLDTVEMLKIDTSQDRWVSGVPLPKKVYFGSQLLTIQSSLLMVHNHSLFEMRCQEGQEACHWREARVWQEPMVFPQLFILSNLRQGPTFCQ